jgi:hypothetical protein
MELPGGATGSHYLGRTRPIASGSTGRRRPGAGFLGVPFGAGTYNGCLLFWVLGSFWLAGVMIVFDWFRPLAAGQAAPSPENSQGVDHEKEG